MYRILGTRVQETAKQLADPEALTETGTGGVGFEAHASRLKWRVGEMLLRL